MDIGTGQQLVKYVEVSLTGMLLRNARLAKEEHDWLVNDTGRYSFHTELCIK